MNSSTMHHVASAQMEQRLAAAEASRLAKEARRARSASEVGGHHPIDWMREILASVATTLGVNRHAGATGH